MKLTPEQVKERMSPEERIAFLKSLLDTVMPAIKFYADETFWVAREGGGGLRVEGYDCEDNALIYGFSGRRARDAAKKVLELTDAYIKEAEAKNLD